MLVVKIYSNGIGHQPKSKSPFPCAPQFHSLILNTVNSYFCIPLNRMQFKTEPSLFLKLYTRILELLIL